MNYKMMGRFIAQILAIEGIFMIPAMLIIAAALLLGRKQIESAAGKESR